MRKPRLAPLMIVAVILLCCTRPAPLPHSGKIDGPSTGAGKYPVSHGETQSTFDTNGDSRPDVIETYRNGDLIKIERDRNFDGRVDLLEEYQHGKLVRMVRDDNFDGKPETINTYRNGRLAIAERDPDACGSVDRADYYDDTGNLVRSEIRNKTVAGGIR
jgi:hypothetical protein